MVSKASSRAREVAVGGRAAAARLAEVDVAGELADDQDVRPATSSGLRLGRVRQLLVADRRPEVGEQPQVLAQARGCACSGRSARSSLSYFQSPTAPNSTASAACAKLQRRFGQWMAVRLVGSTADAALPPVSHFRSSAFSTLNGLGDDFGADAVARQDCDLHGSVGVES